MGLYGGILKKFQPKNLEFKWDCTVGQIVGRYGGAVRWDGTVGRYGGTVCGSVRKKIFVFVKLNVPLLIIVIIHCSHVMFWSYFSLKILKILSKKSSFRP